MPSAIVFEPECRTCFFGVEQLCCLNVQGRGCPTYRPLKVEAGETAPTVVPPRSEWAVTTRREPRRYL
ncbi:MAG: hypothetical protein Kow00122_02930 [Thermoleophilia bacterium]